MKALRVGVAVVLAGVAVALAGGGAASGRAPGKALIAFSSRGHIYTIAADGSGRQQLTRKPRPHGFTFDSSPAWSPSASKIAFAREGLAAGDTTMIYVMRADGTHERLLVPSKAHQDDGFPAFSPDGSKIAFDRQVQLPHGVATKLLVADADGTDVHVVLRRIWREGDGIKRFRFLFEPVWSPDGSRLFFTESRFHQSRHAITFLRSLHAVAATGGEAQLIAHHASSPSFSPSGKRMVYVSEADRNGTTCYEDCSINGELYVSLADGTEARRLTDTKFDEEIPDWSADGGEIAYQRSKDNGAGRLFAIRPSGKCGSVLLADGRRGLGFAPDWQPDPSASSDPGVCGTPAHRDG